MTAENRDNRKNPAGGRTRCVNLLVDPRSLPSNLYIFLLQALCGAVNQNACIIHTFMNVYYIYLRCQLFHPEPPKQSRWPKGDEIVLFNCFYNIKKAIVDFEYENSRAASESKG